MRLKEIAGDREREVLRAVVENHLDNPVPVGSRTLSRKKLAELNLSPATIRNVMADLDELGFTVQPHPSAGRVPTDKGYRYFVDNLMTKRKLSEKEMRLIDLSFNAKVGSHADIMELTSKMLSSLSHQVGVIVVPGISSIVIEKFHFIKVSDFNIQVVLVATHGYVKNFLLELDENWSEPELTHLANFVNGNYSGKPLRQIRRELKKKVKKESNLIQKLKERALKIQEKLISKQEAGEVAVDGASQLLDVPEFNSDTGKLKKLFDALSDKKRLLIILDKCVDKKEAAAEIGRELDSIDFEDCSLVSCGYGHDLERRGAIGLIGPRHMDYPYAFGLLEYLSGALNRAYFSE